MPHGRKVEYWNLISLKYCRLFTWTISHLWLRCFWCFRRTSVLAVVHFCKHLVWNELQMQCLDDLPWCDVLLQPQFIYLQLIYLTSNRSRICFWRIWTWNYSFFWWPLLYQFNCPKQGTHKHNGSATGWNKVVIQSQAEQFNCLFFLLAYNALVSAPRQFWLHQKWCIQLGSLSWVSILQS